MQVLPEQMFTMHAYFPPVDEVASTIWDTFVTVDAGGSNNAKTNEAFH